MLNRHALAQPTHDAQHARTTLLGYRLHSVGPGVDGQRRPDLNLFTAHGEIESGRGDAHHQVRLAIQVDGPADDSNISAKPRFPERMTDDDYPRTRIFVLGPKPTPKSRLNLEQRKEIPGHDLAAQLNGLSGPGERDRRGAIRHQVIENGVLVSKVEQVRIRDVVRARGAGITPRPYR